MSTADMEKELRESVAYFEQILDVLPGEHTALEFLCVACRQLGDSEKYLKYALQLTDIVLREKNAESAADLIENLKAFEDPQARKAVLKLQVLVAPQPAFEFERPVDRQTAATPSVAAKAERALLEKLVAEGVLARAHVQIAFEQLENPPTAEGDFLISALAILEKENLTGAADAVAAVADAAHAPPVPLDMFELVPADVRKLPDRLIKVRGVVPFARLGGDWAVALLNPLDEALKEEVSALLGAKCHFFIAQPSTVAKALERIFSEEDEARPVEAVSGEAPPVVNLIAKAQPGMGRSES